MFQPGTSESCLIKSWIPQTNRTWRDTFDSNKSNGFRNFPVQETACQDAISMPDHLSTSSNRNFRWDEQQKSPLCNTSRIDAYLWIDLSRFMLEPKKSPPSKKQEYSMYVDVRYIISVCMSVNISSMYINICTGIWMFPKIMVPPKSSHFN